MPTDTSNPHKSSGSTPESDENLSNGHLYQTVPFSPVTHNVNAYIQIDDGNHIYETVVRQHELQQRSTGRCGDSDAPFCVGYFSPSWVLDETEYEAGHYSSPTGIGYLDSTGEVTLFEDQWFSLFESCENGTKATLPAKCTINLEPRTSDLVNKRGDPFSYPKAHDGVRYEGTYIKVNSSYAQSPEELLSWVQEWFEHLDAEWGTDLMDYWEPIWPTYYIGGLERHVRFHIDAIERGVFAADNTKRLCHTGNEREARRGSDIIENGRFRIFQFATTELDELGFDQGPRDDEGNPTVRSDKVKIYRAANASRYGCDNFRHHPKYETRINEGKFHVSNWDDLVARSDSILLTHLDYASITEDDLVSDDFFRPVTKDGDPVDDHPTWQSTEHTSPRGRMAELRDFWRSDETRRTLEGLVYHSQTDTYRFILTALNFKFSGPVTYQQLMEATGLSYSGVRRAVTKLVEANLLTRIPDHVTYVDWANQFAYEKGRAWLREHLDPREALVEMAAAAVDNALRREGAASTSNEAPEEEPDHDDRDDTTDIDERDEQAVLPGYEGLSAKERRELEQEMEAGTLPAFGTATLLADGGTD
jgi:hypothetical protein